MSPTALDAKDKLDHEALLTELAAVEQELQRRRWLADPVAWAEERLQDTLWSGQRRLLQAVAANRRTAFPSCHEASKTFTAAIVAGWWLDCHLPGEAFVVTSAPTDPQVRAILWREMGRMHVRGNLAGRLNQTEWHLVMPGGNEELIAMGRKPSDYSPTAFQGIHARYVLVILDEAPGIAAILWEAVDTLIANDYSKLLAMGNPDDPQCEFAKACLPGSGYTVVQVGAFDTPNFTGEPFPEKIKQSLIGRTYVEEKRKKWAPNWYWLEDGSRCVPPADQKVEDSHPFWQSKILGQFPVNQEANGLIPIAWIKAAQQRRLEPIGPHEYSLDVGGGSDASTHGMRKGPVFRVLQSDHNPDTMETCGNMVARLKDPRLCLALAKVDYIGIGRGVVDRAKELITLNELLVPVEGINDGEGAVDPTQYLNRRAEDWWFIRSLFETGAIDIDERDEELAGELASLRYKRTSNGKIQVESKAEARARGVASPNRADCLKLAYVKPRVGYGPMQVVKLAGFN